jgi:hypothetical protein
MGNIAEMVAKEERREGLQPGDVVAVFSGGFHSRIRKSTVSRVTNAQAIIDGVRYSKRGGRQIGHQGYNVPWIELWIPAHDEILAKQQAEQKMSSARSKLINIKWFEVNDEIVLAALAQMQALGVVK